MNALLLADDGLRVAEVPVPARGRDEALVRVTLAGICGTDLELLAGYGDFRGVLGHEFVGVVEQAPSAEWVGRRVVGEINVGCGRCDACARGDEHWCPERTAIGIRGRNGAFAELLAIPLRNLHLVPESVADEAAVFTEPLAAALRLRERAHVRPTDRVAVLGPGRLGLLVAQVLALDGAAVTVLGRRSESLELPLRLGLPARHVANAPDHGYDLVAEATGSRQGVAEALRLVRPGGIVALKSTVQGPAELALSTVVVDELTLLGSRCGPFEPALRLLERGAIEVLALIDAEYRLADGPAAFEHAAQPGVRKILLRP